MALAEVTKEWTIELGRAKVDRGADRIERVYCWEVERILTGVRAALAVAGSVVALVIAAVLEEVGQVGPWQILVAAAALGISVGAAVFLHAKLSRLFGNYLESLHVFAVVQRPVETDQWIPSHSP